jgi:hypothetical protein
MWLGMSNATLRRGVQFLIMGLLILVTTVARAADPKLTAASLVRLEYSPTDQGIPIDGSERSQP